MGLFLSADWALMSDVIPKATSGRYMGILNAGTAMAGPVFIIVAGPIQDRVGPRLERSGRAAGGDGGRGGLRGARRAGAHRASTRVGSRTSSWRHRSRQLPPRREPHVTMSVTSERARRTGPRELAVVVTRRYRLMRVLVRRPSASCTGSGRNTSSAGRRRRSSSSATTIPAGTRCWSPRSLRSGRGSPGSAPRSATSRAASRTG